MKNSSKTKDQLIHEIAQMKTRFNKLEKKLVKTKQSVEAVINSIEDILFYKDKKGIYLGCNQRFAQFVNKEIKDIIGKTDHDLFPKQDADFHRKKDRLVLKDKRANIYEKKLTYPDGEKRLVETHKSPMFNDKGRIIGIIGLCRDITARKEAEDRLKLTKFGIDHSQIGIFQVNDEGDIYYINEQACKSLGYSANELLQLKIWDIDPNMSGERWKVHRKNIRSRPASTIETIHRRKDGTIFPVEVTINMIKFGNKNISISFAKDISERKLVEQELRENEKRLDLALKGADLGLWDWDIKTGKVTYNERWAEMLGFKLDEIKSNLNTWEKLVDPDHMPRVMKTLDDHLEGKIPLYECEYRIKTKSGGWRWVLDRGKILEWDENGNPLRAAGTHLDITERKQIEQALRESEEKYRNLVEYNPAGITIHSEGKVIYANKACIKLMGAKKIEEIVGKHVLDFIHPDYRKVVTERIKRSQVEGVIAEPMEEKFLKLDGKVLDVEVTSIPVTYEGKVGTQAVIWDITERKQLEDQLRQVQKMEAVGRLAGGVAHDFNNLLTVINGYCDTLLFRELSPQIRGPVEQIQSACTRATRMISQLLAFSRKQIIQPIILNLNVLINDELKMLNRLLGEDIEIITILDRDLKSIKADPGQIDQILINIVINARDAMPLGGKLTIETANIEFDDHYIQKHSGAQRGSFIMLAITDTGIGMDESTRSQIFEPFYTTKDHDKGTGLGLATVYGIVKQNNGFIYVKSKPEEGSTFNVYFPMVEIPRENSQKLQTDPEKLKGNETIFLVEDDDEVREVTLSILNYYGYSVLTAKNGKEALHLYKEHDTNIDLLITDVIMPVMNGRELAEELKGKNPSLKVLFFSGHSDDSIVKQGVLDEGLEFIQKPFSHIDLAKKVREVLDK